MRSAEERRALADLRACERLLDGLGDLLLDGLARDDQPNEPAHPFAGEQADHVHDAARTACGAIAKASRSLNTARNALRWLRETDGGTPGVRERAVPDCLACGRPALPRPRSGFCNACAMAYGRRDRRALPDRAAFMAERRAMAQMEADVREGASWRQRRQVATQ